MASRLPLPQASCSSSPNKTNQELKLWISDGTAGGTNVIKTFEKPDGRDPFNMLAVGNRVYFPARDAKHGFELWPASARPRARPAKRHPRRQGRLHAILSRH